MVRGRHIQQKVKPGQGESDAGESQTCNKGLRGHIKYKAPRLQHRGPDRASVSLALRLYCRDDYIKTSVMKRKFFFSLSLHTLTLYNNRALTEWGGKQVELKRRLTLRAHFHYLDMFVLQSHFSGKEEEEESEQHCQSQRLCSYSPFKKYLGFSLSSAEFRAGLLLHLPPQEKFLTSLSVSFLASGNPSAGC